MTHILLINGTNLNLLGVREPEVYGSETLQDIVDELRSYASDRGVELSDFRPFNIESMGGETSSRVEVASVSKQILAQLGSGAASEKRDLRNVGPSFQYKLRDAQGQAREYHNYMLPLELE